MEEEEISVEVHGESGSKSNTYDTPDVQIEEEYTELVEDDNDQKSDCPESLMSAQNVEPNDNHNPSVGTLGVDVQHEMCDEHSDLHDSQKLSNCIEKKRDDSVLLENQEDCLTEGPQDDNPGPDYSQKLSDDRHGQDSHQKSADTVRTETDDGETLQVVESPEEGIDEESSVEHIEDADQSSEVENQWVFLVESNRYRAKVLKQFSKRPMSLKRSRQEISASKRRHFIALYPVSPDVMCDPDLLAIFDTCTEVHADYHRIHSDTSTSESKMAVYLQLWFKHVSDIDNHIGHLSQLCGPSVHVYSESLSDGPSYAEFHDSWKKQYQGPTEATMIIPFLPNEVTEDDLWTVFPMASIIALPEECEPNFRYAYVNFIDKEMLKTAVNAINMLSPPSRLRKLHLVPIELLLSNPDDLSVSRQQAEKQHAKKLKNQMDVEETQVCSSVKGWRRKQRDKPGKTTKSVSTILKKKKTFPGSKAKPFVRSVRYVSKAENVDDTIALADLLITLGPRAPNVMNTLAKALEETQIQEFSSEEYLDVQYTPPASDYEVNVFDQPPSKGRGRRHNRMFPESVHLRSSSPGGQKTQSIHQETRGKNQDIKSNQRKQKSKRQHLKGYFDLEKDDRHRAVTFPHCDQSHQDQGTSIQTPRQSQWSARRGRGYQGRLSQVPLPGPGRGGGCLLHYSDDERLSTRSLPTYTRGKGKRRNTKQNVASSYQHNLSEDSEDDGRQTFCHNHKRGSRGHSYSDLVRQHDYFRQVTDSMENNTCVSHSQKNSNNNKKMKPRGTFYGKFGNK